jgi:hypothetical protein
MTLFVYLICTSLIVGFAILVVLRYRRREGSLTEGWTPVDVRAMERLLSAKDDLFLAANVSLLVLLRLRIQRAMAAGEYLSRLRANSRYAVAVAKLNPQQTASLLESATALRLEIAKLQWKVWLGVIAPLDADVQRLDALTRMFAERSKLAAITDTVN